MEFVLNEYHRDTPDEELIADLQRVAKQLNKDSLTRSEYTAYGRFHAQTLNNHFGTWVEVLEKAGLNAKGHAGKLCLTDKMVAEELKRVAAICQTDYVTKDDFSKHAKFSVSPLIERYGNWTNVLALAGMKPKVHRFFLDEEIFEDIERMWVQLGRQPTINDIKRGCSKFSPNTFIRRFGGWRKALEAFVDYINSDAAEKEPDEEAAGQERPAEDSAFPGHRTSREPNLRLRFLVLNRDHFKCCACGASPAKDPSVELHVDHIIPWSKGGETVIDNLQTLCSNCNLGKSDLL